MPEALPGRREERTSKSVPDQEGAECGSSSEEPALADGVQVRRRARLVYLVTPAFRSEVCEALKKRIAGMDFGWDHPTACVWLAEDPDTVLVLDAFDEDDVPVGRDAEVDGQPGGRGQLVQDRQSRVPKSVAGQRQRAEHLGSPLSPE